MLHNPDSQFSDGGKPAYVKIYEQKKPAPIWEQIFVGIWILFTFLPLEGAGPTVIRYACILGFMGLMVIGRKETVPVLLKSWPLFLLPILGLISVGWSPYPDDALRTGILLLLTPLVIVVMGARMRTQDVLRSMTVAAMLSAIYCAPFYAGFPEGEPFAGKNFFAIQMLFVLVLCLSTALNSEENILLRIAAAPFVPIAFVFQFLAESATSLVFAVVGIAALVGVKLIWGSFGKVRHLRTATFMVIAAIGLLVFVVILANPQSALGDAFLNMLGKDSSFSGRAAIWNQARITAAENLWLGLGLEGFWQYGTGAAQTLNENDHKDFGTKLSFHNAYWEVRVHLGLIGLGLFLYSLFWCVSRTIGLWLRNGNMTNSTLVITMLIIMVSTFTESYVWGTFTTMVNLLYLGGIAAFENDAKKLVARVPIQVRETA